MKYIGRYIICGLLGRGGMGKVYKVELPSIGKIAAVKHLDPDPLVAKLMGWHKLSDLFISEARTMAGLSHPNIVQIHDFDHYQGKPFYVMEFYADNLGKIIGESYQSETPSRQIVTDKALNYARQILKGLACLHEAGIIHRDIKPFNMLIDANDILKICDFGLSKLRGETYAGPANLNVGSPYYAAPEQERQPDKVAPNADLYSVGVLLYRMLTGKLPDNRAGEKKYHPVKMYNANLDDAWDDFLTKAIDEEPQKRYSSSMQMLIALDQLSEHWQTVKEKLCHYMEPPPPKAHQDSVTNSTLRCTAIKSAPKEAMQTFHLDWLWRPLTYTRNDYHSVSEHTILDRSTNLVWQRTGSNAPCNWYQAQKYILQLNEAYYDGHHTWRLPTIDELISILAPPGQGDEFCIEPIFSAEQKRLWSIDRRSFVAAYYMDAQLGFIGWQDMSAPYYVRAVCPT